GLRVRYTDIDPTSHLLDPAALETVLDDSVGVVVVTHLYGRAADVDAAKALCTPRGIAVLEDCAQAIGVRTPAGLVGSLASVATFSFYPTKNLGALGDGGAIVTQDDALADRLRAARQYGWEGKYTITLPDGRNSRLDEVQAAVLRHRLTLVDETNARRRAIIGRYAAAASERVRVLPADGLEHAAHLAVVETESAAELIAHLGRHEVRTDVHYPVPDHRQPAFAAEYADIELPVTDALVGRIVSLPCFPELTRNEIEQVCDALASY
ncbi:MAG TPA: DegT/DnrJ/EryC1/StrS family aminotransferase, partial [Coriobacteriia bacterium]|nr:DegT/DnrJ/EryC1/StrS family aminotransferase [Coriobacteriia bacterium]